MSSDTRHRVRYLVPLAAVAITAGVILIPQAASGAQHPTLAPRSAAQLLAAIEQAKVPQFSGTTVETARLGLPSLNDVNLPGVNTDNSSTIGQVLTLLTGSHTTQIAYGGPNKQRVAIFLSNLSETDIVHNGTNVWTYSSDTNSVSHSTVKPDSSDDQTPDAAEPVDPTKAAEHALAGINPSTKVSVDRTAEVAGRSAYQLDLFPRDSRTLISSVRIALDSQTSLPLRVEIWSRNNLKRPAFSVGFTSISMTAPSASTFTFSKPSTARMQSSPFSDSPSSIVHASAGPKPAEQGDNSKTIGKDWTSILVDTLQTSRSITTSTTPAGNASGVPQPTRVTCRAGSPCTTNKPGAGAPSLADTLRQLGTRVSNGTLLTTSLVSILVTNDNRLLIGAVTPRYLEQVAASQAAK